MTQNQIIRLSITEAARLFGVEQKTIRRAVAKQEIKYIVVRGRYKLNFESLLEWSQKRTSTKNKLIKNGIGQYVEQWRIRNRLYSPHPDTIRLSQKNDQA